MTNQNLKPERPAMHDSSASRDPLAIVGHYFTRYAFVAILLWVGALKFTAYEAEGG